MSMITRYRVGRAVPFVKLSKDADKIARGKVVPDAEIKKLKKADLEKLLKTGQLVEEQVPAPKPAKKASKAETSADQEASSK